MLSRARRITKENAQKKRINWNKTRTKINKTRRSTNENSNIRVGTYNKSNKDS